MSYVEIPYAEFEKLVALELINDHTDRVKAEVVGTKHGHHLLGDTIGYIYNWPDWLLVREIRKNVITQACDARIMAEIGEMDFKGDIYDGTGHAAPMAELAVTSRATLPGIILDELCRRLEDAIRYDEAQQANEIWEPPEPWPPGDTDDPPAAD